MVNFSAYEHLKKLHGFSFDDIRWIGSRHGELALTDHDAIIEFLKNTEETVMFYADVVVVGPDWYAEPEDEGYAPNGYRLRKIPVLKDDHESFRLHPKDGPISKMVPYGS